MVEDTLDLIERRGSSVIVADNKVFVKNCTLLKYSIWYEYSRPACLCVIDWRKPF